MSPSKIRWRTLGVQITDLIKALDFAHQCKRTQSVTYIAERTGFEPNTVYKWRQGRLRPSDPTLKILAHTGYAEAKLDRSWGKRLFKEARHPDADQLVEQIWGPVQVCTIPNNLPRPNYSEFIGRQEELKTLLKLLAPESGAHLIMVDGIGGVGKTALVVKAAYHCLQLSRGGATDPYEPLFDVIIFVSAKQQFLTPAGIWARSHVPNTLSAIFREMAQVLGVDIARAAPEEQPGLIRHALGRQRTLLIIDNLETVEDKDRVLAFLYDLSPAVKAVITTREQRFYTPIQLECLPEDDGIQLIQHEAEKQEVTINYEDVQSLYKRTDGIPAAIIYAVGQLAAGRDLANVLIRLADYEGDVARFFFQDSVAPLRGQPAHKLLMAIAMFTRRPLCKLAQIVAGTNGDPRSTNEAEVQLQQLSLVRKRDQHFVMHPLTREYTLAELAAHGEFEHSARDRWVQVYLNYVGEHGGEDWGEWHIHYDEIEAEWDNLLAAMDWCIEQRRYEDIKLFWQNLKGFTLIYGYWDVRLVLLQWLIQEAERRGDWMIGVEALYQKAWTLIVMGREEQLAEAESLLTQAWQLRDHVKPELQSYVADYIAEHHVRHKRYDQACHWLDISQQLLAQTQLDARACLRKQVNTCYWRAILYFKTEDYEQAALLFHEVQQLGQQISWKRIIYYAQNWLADIAILQDQLDHAQRLLHEGLQVVERNKDRRRIALYKRSFACLEQKRNNLPAGHKWACEALDAFERLSMQPEAEEMRTLLPLFGKSS